MSVMDWSRLLRGLFRPRAGVILALGGGGARGLAHVGVLSVLEEQGIPVTGVAGTSAGALVGAMWLTLGGSDAVTRRWREFLASDFPGSLPDVRLTDSVSSRDSVLLQYARRLRRGAAVLLALGRRFLIEKEDFDTAVAFLVPDVRIEDLSRPFCAVATDFSSGAPVALRRGSLREAVAASSTVPGVVAPRTIDGRVLVDGGVVADVPVRQARLLGRRPVVAVSVGEALPDEAPGDVTVPRAIMRAGIITHAALLAEVLRDSGLTLRPAVGRIHWSEFTRFDEAVDAGRREAEAHLPSLRRAASMPDLETAPGIAEREALDAEAKGAPGR
jgi:NTE family protein